MSMIIDGLTDPQRTDLVDHRLFSIWNSNPIMINVTCYSNKFVHNYPIIVHCTIAQVLEKRL